MELIIELLFRNRKAIRKLAKKYPELVSLGWLGVGAVGLYKALTANQVTTPAERQDGELMTEWHPVPPLTKTVPMDEPKVFHQSLLDARASANAARQAHDRY